MPHWSDKYIGRPYQLHTYDCASLIQEIAKEEFDIDGFIPAEHGSNSVGHQRQFMRYKSVSLEPIDKSSIQEGDLVLMISAGRMNHIGVYYKDKASEWVVHNAAQVGAVIRTRLRSLSQLGYAIEGFYRWKKLTTLHAT